MRQNIQTVNLLLDVLYPASDERFRRLKVQRGGRVLGICGGARALRGADI